LCATRRLFGENVWFQPFILVNYILPIVGNRNPLSLKQTSQCVYLFWRDRWYHLFVIKLSNYFISMKKVAFFLWDWFFIT
jgi:hypothetical protein